MRRNLTGFDFASVMLVGVSLLPICGVRVEAPAEAAEKESMTPLLMKVAEAPVAFRGSDGRAHLVYELQVSNFSSGDASVEKVEVLADGAALQTLDASAVARQLQPAGTREPSGKLAKSSQALLFLDVTLAADSAMPKEISHRVTARFAAAPPGHQEITLAGGVTSVSRREAVVIGPPLQGERYVSADSCCGSSRHRRAAMAINGNIWITQRFAVDWEELDASGHIYAGPKDKLESYAIFGKPALAVADAVVDSVTDGAEEQTPGQYPTNIELDQADGNCVILDLGADRAGKHSYALYAHLQPGSIRVHPGDKVKRGETLGLVGNTGNSVAPHLHFQVMDGPSSLASNGLPYEIEEFLMTGETAGTEAFDKAEGEGLVLPVMAVQPARVVRSALPLDQLVIAFDGKR